MLLAVPSAAALPCASCLHIQPTEWYAKAALPVLGWQPPE